MLLNDDCSQCFLGVEHPSTRPSFYLLSLDQHSLTIYEILIIFSIFLDLLVLPALSALPSLDLPRPSLCILEALHAIHLVASDRVHFRTSLV